VTYLVSLSIVGVLGIMCWFFVIQAVRRRRRWARSVATLVLFVGTSVGLFGLLVRDTSGDTGLPPSLGWLGMLPCLAGVVAVSLLWRARPTAPVASNA
jgi:predicted permease